VVAICCHFVIELAQKHISLFECEISAYLHPYYRGQVVIVVNLHNHELGSWPHFLGTRLT